MAIVFMLARTFPGHRVPIKIHSFSDNTGAESGSNKLFTMKYPQCLFVEKLCLLSATCSMELDVQHIAGKNNDEADALSRWSGSDTIPYGFDASDRMHIALSDLWIPQVIHQCMPKRCFHVMEVTNILSQFSPLLEFQSHFFLGYPWRVKFEVVYMGIVCHLKYKLVFVKMTNIGPEEFPASEENSKIK